MRLLALILVLFAGLPGGLWAQAPDSSAANFKGHLIGEGLAEFLSMEPDAQQEVDVCRARPARHSCDRLIAALDRGDRAEISTSGAINFVLDGGKLVKLTMLVDKPFDAATSDLSQKFGPQTSASVLASQNALGAKWNNQLHVWDTPSIYITLYQDNNPSLADHRLLLIAESHAEHLLENMGSQKQRDSVAAVTDQKN